MRCRKGQEAIEWTIVVAFIAAVTMTALFAMVPQMEHTLKNISGALNSSLGVNQQQVAP